MGAATNDLDKRWPASVVPVLLPHTINKAIRDAINQAIDVYERFTFFNFVRYDGEEHYIEFKEDPTGDLTQGDVARSSSGGRNPDGKQYIYFMTPAPRDLPDMVSHILHEMGHAMGLVHEQRRSDRNEFVIINEQNIAAGKGDAFQIISKDDLVRPTRYDYGSRMQYRTNAQGGDKTTIDIRVKPDQPKELVEVIGTAKLLSRRDVATLNYIASPVVGNPLTTGTWQTIDDDHQLVDIGDNLIVDWVTDTGHFRLWKFNPDAAGHENPLSASNQPIQTFPQIGDGHVLVPVGGGMMIDWHRDSGGFRLWDLVRPSIQSGRWEHIKDNRQLVYLGGQRLLDWDDDGNYHLWKFDAADSNLLSGPMAKGKWETIDDDHVLILLSDGNLLDQKDDEYRVWAVDRNATGDQNPLTELLAAGEWSSIDDDHRLVPVGDRRILDWDGDGNFRVWHYPAAYQSYQPNPLSSPTHHGKHSTLGNASALELEDGHLLTWDPTAAKASREFWLWRLNYGNTGGDALEQVWKLPIPDLNGDQLASLPGKRLLNFVGNGKSTVFEYQLNNSGPLVKKTITSHQFTSIDKTHKLVRLASDRVLDWWFVPKSHPGDRDVSKYRVWAYDPSAKGNDNPFLHDPKSSGAWDTTKLEMITPKHLLVPVDGGYVIDWIQTPAFYRIWQLDIHKTENILPLPTLAEGFWSDFVPSTQVIGLSGARVMNWDKNGKYEIRNFAVTPAIRTANEVTDFTSSKASGATGRAHGD